MTLEDIQNVAVIGAGTMGLGIAQIAAAADYSTTLYDIDQKALDTAQSAILNNLDKGIKKGKVTQQSKDNTLSKLQFTHKFEDLKADFVIEAIVENIEAKRELFSKLEDQNSPDCIFASNTSSIPITQIAARLKHAKRLVGMHFFNPAHIMKLVEIISGAATDKGVLNVTKQLAKKIGKIPVMVRDSPGFIANRVARHYYVESLKALEEGVSDVEGIDKLLESTGFKMGPFRLMDLIGVDTNYSVTESMFNAFHQDAKFRPSRIQQQKMNAGHHGIKSGRGFYNYE